MRIYLRSRRCIVRSLLVVRNTRSYRVSVRASVPLTYANTLKWVRITVRPWTLWLTHARSTNRTRPGCRPPSEKNPTVAGLIAAPMIKKGLKKKNNDSSKYWEKSRMTDIGGWASKVEPVTRQNANPTLGEPLISNQDASRRTWIALARPSLQLYREDITVKQRECRKGSKNGPNGIKDEWRI